MLITRSRERKRANHLTRERNERKKNKKKKTKTKTKNGIFRSHGKSYFLGFNKFVSGQVPQKCTKKMLCHICVNAKNAKNYFTAGFKKMRKTVLTDHIKTKDHQAATLVPAQVKNRQKCSTRSNSITVRGMQQIAYAANFKLTFLF